MQEAWLTAFAPINLPFTVALLCFAGYWLLAAVGLFEFEGGDGGGDDLAMLGWLTGSLRFLHAGEVPIMLVLSIFSFCGWSLSMLANWYLNPEFSTLRGLLFFAPILMVSGLLTRFIAAPLRPFFRALQGTSDDHVEIVGKTGRVLTSEVNEKFGLARIEYKGSPIDLQIRADPSVKLHKGDPVLFVSRDEVSGYYRVVPNNQPELN